jgi:hypothetical protein
MKKSSVFGGNNEVNKHKAQFSCSLPRVLPASINSSKPFTFSPMEGNLKQPLKNPNKTKGQANRRKIPSPFGAY